jgi:hypothetical protein
LEDSLSKNSSPIEFFNLFVTSELLDIILEQSQLYATSQSINNSNGKKVDEITVEDIKKAFGIVLYMGILQLPNRRMYWQNKTRVDIIATGVNLFAKIISYFIITTTILSLRLLITSSQLVEDPVNC